MPDMRLLRSLIISIVVLIFLAPVASATNTTTAWIDKNSLYVEYSSKKQMVDMDVFEAVISPDGEKVIYTKRTGGGPGERGRTLFLYDPILRLREPLFQFTDLIKSPNWVRRDKRDFILYTRAQGEDNIDDTVVLFELGPRQTLLTFPGSISGAVSGGGVSYMTYSDSGDPLGEHEFFVDEFIDHGQPVDGLFATASSQLESTAADYGPFRAFDGDWRTCWIEGVDGDGTGEWIEVEFPEAKSLRSIYIITGFHKTHADFGDLFKLNSRLKQAEIEFDGGKKFTANFLDSKDPQMLDLNGVVLTKTVKLTIKGSYPGAEWKDLCISEIIFEMG